MDIISSELSGLIENDVKIPDWMSKLAEENKAAMRDDLDQIANPEQLGENDLFNGDEKSFLNENDIFTTPEQKQQQWTPDYVSLNTNHVEQEYDNVLRQNNYQTNNVNNEIEDLVNRILNENLTLSSVQNMISEKFSNRIAFRYIKSNYHKLAEHFTDDLNLDPHENRVEDAEIHDNYHLENQPKEAMVSTDDVVKEANSVFTKHSPKTLQKHLISVFGQKLFDETFSNFNFNNYYKKQAGIILDKIDQEFKTLIAKKTAKTDSIKILKQKYGSQVDEYINSNNLDKIASFITKGSNIVKREIANTTVREAQQKKKAESFQSKVMFDTIDIVAKQLLNSRFSSTDAWVELQKRFGDKLAFYSKETLEKHAQFVNRKNEKIIERNATNDETNILKSKTSAVDTAPIVREAYLRLMSRESLDNVKKTLITKYGSSVQAAIDNDNLNQVEHKLGYFYADANLFKNCDKMVDFFSKNVKYAFLLKEKKSCHDCQMNIGNICKKTSLVLSRNPLKISKNDGMRIIGALSDIKMVSAAEANGYKDQLIDGDNTPVIKSFLEQAKNSLISKKASKKIVAQNNEIRSFFNDVNDINVNQLTEEKHEFNLSF